MRHFLVQVLKGGKKNKNSINKGQKIRATISLFVDFPFQADKLC